ESEIYAQMLLSRGKGYPLWEPKSQNAMLPEIYKEKGVHIGDVGILTESGGFDYLFNVCHEATHPLNMGRVPDGFKPITGLADQCIEERDTGYQMFHISSDNFGEGLSFRSTVPQGALLILPEDGKRIDHRQVTTFYNYAAECAIMWYTHVSGPLGRRIHNGSLYLITGFDKARAWGVATFSGA
ncbi:hypothetical protein C8R42DRAFT_540764, partial [Lentinula raphanica]